ncbi:MAG TPA: nitroreductase [Woeseiaceae bacterium]|jgi:nitroreductase|nr:nitroreductase [Woeseiaceae bacterium]
MPERGAARGTGTANQERTDDALRELAEQIRARRTVALFLDRPVSRELVLGAIDVARWAPNHHVTEPWHFYLLGPETIEESVELIRIVTTERKAEKIGEFKAASAAERPGWLVVTCRKSDDELLQREDYGSCCCAIQNFMLYLSAAGVASKWSTGAITRDARFLRLLGIDPREEFVVGLIWYGYPKVSPTQSRKPVAEIATDCP